MKAEAEERRCQHCKRDVAAANFPLHEAHCRRFLADCPHCDERLAAAGMQEHLAHAHRQVRCQLCHRRMQQYLLERHQAEECPERSAKCRFCELELPFHKLQAHLDTCGSRTTMCWDCRKYVMYRVLEEHQQACPAREELQAPASAPAASACQHCSRQFTDDQYHLHLNECHLHPPLPGAVPASVPAESAPGPSSLMVSKSNEREVRPKRQDKELASVGRLSLKPPRSKKALGRLAFTAGPQTLEASTFDQLVTCAQCNILLPGPTLQKHEKKCRRVTPVQTLRRSPRHLDKGEESL